MVWPYARWIVAAMEHDKPRRDWTVRKHPRDPVGLLTAAVDLQSAVADSAHPARPNPAAFGLSDPRPQPRRQSLHGRRGHIKRCKWTPLLELLIVRIA